MTNGFVYVVEDERGLIKIGWSQDPRQRMRQIEREHGDLLVWFVTPGTRNLERWLHRRWQHLRVKGEWFEKDDEFDSVLLNGTLLDRPGGLCKFGPSPSGVAA